MQSLATGESSQVATSSPEEVLQAGGVGFLDENCDFDQSIPARRWQIPFLTQKDVCMRLLHH